MKRTTKNIALALGITALATASLPTMANTVDLRVSGTITPTACLVNLGGGGIIDYGVIKPDALSSTDYTVLPVMSLPISITCDAPVKAALRTKSDRPNTAAGAVYEGPSGAAIPPTTVLLFSTARVPVAGLGLDGTNRIGGYGARFTNPSADSVTVANIHRNGAHNPWVASSGFMFQQDSFREISWATTGGTAPADFTVISGDLEVQAYLNKTSELDMTKPIALDGSSVIELVYL